MLCFSFCSCIRNVVRFRRITINCCGGTFDSASGVSCATSGPKSCKQSVCKKTTARLICVVIGMAGDGFAGLLVLVPACAVTCTHDNAHKAVAMIIRGNPERLMALIILLGESHRVQTVCSLSKGRPRKTVSEAPCQVNRLA